MREMQQTEAEQKRRWSGYEKNMFVFIGEKKFTNGEKKIAGVAEQTGATSTKEGVV